MDDPRATIIECLTTGHVMPSEDAEELVDRLIPPSKRILIDYARDLEVERDQMQPIVDAVREYRAVMRTRTANLAFEGALDDGPDMGAEAELAKRARALNNTIDASLAALGVAENDVDHAEVHGELIVRMRESVWRDFEAERDRLREVVTDTWCTLFAADRASDEVELLSAEHAAMIPGTVRAAFAAANEARGALETERDRLRATVTEVLRNLLSPGDEAVEAGLTARQVQELSSVLPQHDGSEGAADG